MKTTGAIALGATAGALVGVIAMGTWLYASRSQDDASTASSEPKQAQGVRQESKDQPASSAPRQASMPDAFADSLPARMPTAEEGLRAAREATEKHEARWEADLDSPIAAAELEQQVVTVAGMPVMREIRYQPDHYEVSCKSSMCRIDTKFLPGADASEWTTRMLIEMGGAFGASTTVAQPLPGGEMNVVVYAYRAGREPKS